MLTLGLAGWLSGLLTLGFLIICIVMILIVLIQRPQGGGLSGAFGASSGSGQTAFGAKTGDALTFATIGIFVLFLLSAIGLNFAARPSEAQPDQPAATAPADEASAELAEDVSGAGEGAGEAADEAAADAAGSAGDAGEVSEADAPAPDPEESDPPSEGGE